MNLEQIIKARRSVRKFEKGKAVTEEQLNRILEAAIWAPSAGNTQCWRFYVVRNEKIKEELAVKAGHQPFICDAALVIVVCADLDHIGRSYGSRGRDTYSVQDTAAAIENILLTVTDLGLASCWIGAFDESKAASILKLPDGQRPLAMLPIGVPADTPSAPKRKAMADVVKFIE